MLVSPHVEVLKYLLNIVSLVHAQCSSLMVVGDSNAKDFLHLSQVLDFECCGKRLLESNDSRDCCRGHNNVINIEKQHDVLLTMNQEAWVSITLVEPHLDKFSNTLFMSVSCGLLKFIQASHYA